MRSIRLIAALTGVLALGTACGGGGGTAPNAAPVAAFTPPSCTAGAACNFTDASTDDHGISSWAWDFGDPTSGDANASTDQNPTHTFAAAGTYQVKLTVTDAGGETSSKTNPVTVGSATALTAAFTPSCNANVCTFTNTSTGASGSFTSSWDFGEPSSGASNTSADLNPTHTYTVTAVTPFTITLTVTDATNATATSTQTITVSPAAGLACDNGSGSTSACTLDITQKAIVTVTLTSKQCEFVGNRFAITQPIQQTLFTNGCSVAPGTAYTLNGPNPDKSFDAPTSLQAEFTQGSGKPTDPPKGPPAIRVTGSFPDWTVAIDDGGNLGGVGEPDFADIVLAVHAEVVP